MNQKYEITKTILNILNVPASEKKLKELVFSWWANPRSNQKNGLRLTSAGFKAFQDANIKLYDITLSEPIEYTNSMVLWLDRHIECPFYLEKYKIFLTSEKMVIQLVLFEGNINLLKKSQEKHQEKQTLDV